MTGRASPRDGAPIPADVPLPERLAGEAEARCIAAQHGDVGEPPSCEVCVAWAIRQALDEAARVARDYGMGPLSNALSERAQNQAAIAAAIEALR